MKLLQIILKLNKKKSLFRMVYANKIAIVEVPFETNLKNTLF